MKTIVDFIKKVVKAFFSPAAATIYTFLIAVFLTLAFFLPKDKSKTRSGISKMDSSITALADKTAQKMDYIKESERVNENTTIPETNGNSVQPQPIKSKVQKQTLQYFALVDLLPKLNPVKTIIPIPVEIRVPWASIFIGIMVAVTGIFGYVGYQKFQYKESTNRMKKAFTPVELAKATKIFEPFFKLISSPRKFRRLINKIRLNYARLTEPKMFEGYQDKEELALDTIRFMLMMELISDLKTAESPEVFSKLAYQFHEIYKPKVTTNEVVSIDKNGGQTDDFRNLRVIPSGIKRKLIDVMQLFCEPIETDYLDRDFNKASERVFYQKLRNPRWTLIIQLQAWEKSKSEKEVKPL